MTTVLAALQADMDVTRHSHWLVVDQSMIDRFADATLDHQFIHIDPVRAVGTAFGGTVAHGFLTLSLLTALFTPVAGSVVRDAKMLINYGFDRVRFVHPVRSGSRIRASFTLREAAEKRPGQFQQSYEAVVECEGAEKPALTAIWLLQFVS